MIVNAIDIHRLLPMIVLDEKASYLTFCPVSSLTDLSVRVKCSPDDTVGDLKKLIAAQTGTDWQKIQLKKWRVLFALLSFVILNVYADGRLGTPSTKTTSHWAIMRSTMA